MYLFLITFKLVLLSLLSSDNMPPEISHPYDIACFFKILSTARSCVLDEFNRSIVVYMTVT